MDYNVFVGRQPIFDKQNKVFAYEIFFRDGTENKFNFSNGDMASKIVLNRVFMDFSLQKLSNNKLIFINFTENLLDDPVISLIPKEQVVIEILETAKPTEKLLKLVKELHKQKFLLALDDFSYNCDWKDFLPFVNYVKVDFEKTHGIDREKIVQRVAAPHLQVLAEKVETYEDYHEAKRLGYDLFQGYYFCKPSLISSQKIAENHMNYIQLLKEVNKDIIDYKAIETLIKRELSLTYKLLKFLNSSYFSFSTEIKSVRNALTLLGHKEIAKWISLVVLDIVGYDKPQELIRVSLIRALFCENFARTVMKRNEHEEFYLLGLLSLIDAILDKDKQEALGEINVSRIINDTLLGEKTMMSSVLELILALENNDFAIISEVATRNRTSIDTIMLSYFNAINIADTLLSSEEE